MESKYQFDEWLNLPPAQAFKKIDKVFKSNDAQVLTHIKDPVILQIFIFDLRLVTARGKDKQVKQLANQYLIIMINIETNLSNYTRKLEQELKENRKSKSSNLKTKMSNGKKTQVAKNVISDKQSHEYSKQQNHEKGSKKKNWLFTAIQGFIPESLKKNQKKYKELAYKSKEHLKNQEEELKPLNAFQQQNSAENTDVEMEQLNSLTNNNAKQKHE